MYKKSKVSIIFNNKNQKYRHYILKEIVKKLEWLLIETTTVQTSLYLREILSKKFGVRKNFNFNKNIIITSVKIQSTR
jgi:hypothetical protein